MMGPGSDEMGMSFDSNFVCLHYSGSLFGFSGLKASVPRILSPSGTFQGGQRPRIKLMDAAANFCSGIVKTVYMRMKIIKGPSCK